MKNDGYILVFGGTGFIGRVLVWTLLKLGRKCIIVSRKTSFDVVSSSFKELWGKSSVEFLTNKVKKHDLIVINGIEYSQKKYTSFLLDQILKKSGVGVRIDTIINVAGNTSGNSREIETSILGESEFLIAFIQKLKKSGVSPKVIHLSSVAAKYPFFLEPPYEKAKRESEEMLKQIGVLDYNVYIGYAKGLGEKKMRAAAVKIWPYFSASYLMCSIKASVVDVERLALYFLLLAEGLDLHVNDSQKKCIDVFVSNGIINFGAMLKALLPSELQGQIKMPHHQDKLIEFAERFSLLIKGTLTELTHPNDQFLRRMSHFMKLASGSGVGWFERKYNNLSFFNLKPGSESQEVDINKTAKVMFKKRNSEIPGVYFDNKRRLLYILKELPQSKIISFILK